MIGVRHGFFDSVLPNKIVEKYSDIPSLKPHLAQDDHAIAQDLGLRLGTQMASKATVGAAVFAGLNGIDGYGDDDKTGIDALTDPMKIIPSGAAAWLTSDYINKFLPGNHKRIVGKERSIYK